MVRGRRPRITAASKGQLKISAAIMKKDCKTLRKVANGVTCDSTIQTITQRTRNLRKSLHKIQKQFDNQAITKFFQRTLKAHSYPRFSGSDSDENACDAFAAEQLLNLSGNNNEMANNDENDIVTDEPEVSFNGSQDEDVNHEHFDVDKNDNDDDDVMNLSLTNGEHIDQNSNGSSHTTQSHNSIQPTNIFLQKPVLHLNIDKSLIQSSSIVINKHLDACPNFAAASFPVFNASSGLNTANKQIQSKSSEEDESCAEQNEMQSMDDARESKGQQMKCEKQRLRKRRPRKCASRWADARLHDAIDSDSNNSCDSGVVSDRSFELSSTDGNKPTTPHRIVVCPSTSTPTSEESPKIQQQPNTNRINAVKRSTVKRARGRPVQKGQRINDAKSYFTKLTAAADAQAKTEDAIKPENDSQADDAKNDVDCEISALNIESNDNEVLKSASPMPISRSSTPLKPMQSKQMTDFFPMRRRSVRKTKKAVEQEYLRTIEKAIEQQSEDGLVVKLFKDKGRGICAGRPFARGEFVVEYIGDLIEQNEADRREEIYAKDTAFGCYMYYFKHKEQQWCIDATAETGNLGRLVNHSRNGNLMTKIVTYKNRPHLVLIAKENIKEGEELTYDYGDRTRESLVNHPWLAL